MPNSFAHMAEYASQCYIADVTHADTIKIDDPKPNTLLPSHITKKMHFKSPKRTELDVQVFYENGARLVYLRGKHRLGPILSHMHESDIMKILSVP